MGLVSLLANLKPLGIWDLLNMPGPLCEVNSTF